MGTNVVPADAGAIADVYDSLEALRSLLIEGEQHRSMCRSAPTLRAQASSHHGRRDDWPPHHRPARISSAASLRSTCAGRTSATQRSMSASSARRCASPRIAAAIWPRTEGPPSNRRHRRVCGSSRRRRCIAPARRARRRGARSGAFASSRRSAPKRAVSRSAPPAEWRRRPYGGADEGDSSPMARLQRAKEMLQNGLLNDAEFEQIKAKILAEL